MRKYAILGAIVAAIAAAAAIVAFARAGDEGPPSSPPPAATDLDRARELIRDCRVRSTVSLHSGAFYLELKDGSRFDLPAGSDGEVHGEIQRASGRCGQVAIAME